MSESFFAVTLPFLIVDIEHDRPFVGREIYLLGSHLNIVYLRAGRIGIYHDYPPGIEHIAFKLVHRLNLLDQFRRLVLFAVGRLQSEFRERLIPGNRVFPITEPVPAAPVETEQTGGCSDPEILFHINRHVGYLIREPDRERDFDNLSHFRGSIPGRDHRLLFRLLLRQLERLDDPDGIGQPLQIVGRFDQEDVSCFEHGQ